MESLELLTNRPNLIEVARAEIKCRLFSYNQTIAMRYITYNQILTRPHIIPIKKAIPMAHYNMIAGGIFGLIAVLAGAVLSDQVKLRLDNVLLEKAVAVPAVLHPDGTIARDATTEISIIDRRENEDAWLRYLTGNFYLMFNGLAMIALGLIGAQAGGDSRIAIAGGACFTVGNLLFAVCMSAAAALSMPTLRVPIPVGAILLAAGWICLIVVSMKAKRPA
ncbi:DUF423 domain-containing protein [Blastopirellula sp. J2-11]|uniref:DUF423 domain-containing protein n=1 Tax=Blastopirellula sp. J2-11 TaxID=2943192 RepID=UPI0021C6E67F|nr:DUF423 domain-containing protein [Blastopirellula sp. J2-11]UUO08463.1 DUF423 domain-containing protein [Blastopirellula sp. J2-11]